MNKNTFIKGTLILIVGNLITKLLGFVYRIYISNAIGSEGMGLFQLIFPVYSMIMTVATSGVSLAISSLVAEEYAKKNVYNIRKLIKIALFAVFLFSGTISFIMYLNINWVASSLLKDARTYSSLLIFLPCIPLLTCTAILKGYFYGMKNMLPSALSQFFEQIIRIGSAMFLIHYLKTPSLEISCAYAVGGMMLGEITGCLYIFYCYYKDKNKKLTLLKNQKTASAIILFTSLMTLSIPITLSRFFTSLLHTMESILIPRRLLLMGLEQNEAMSLFGKFSGMAMPLIYFPAMITFALATNLIPTLSEAKTLKQTKSLKKAVYLSIQFTLLIGFFSFGLFYFFGSNISNAFYKAEKVGGVLSSLSFVCVFLYLESTLFGILNGLNKQKTCFINGLIGSIIRLIGIYFFIPHFGLQAIIISFILSMGVTCLLNLQSVISNTGISIDLGNWIVLPCAAAIFSGWVTKYISFYFYIPSTGFTYLFVILSIFSVLYGILLLFFGCISTNQLTHLLKELKISKYFSKI